MSYEAKQANLAAPYKSSVRVCVHQRLTAAAENIFELFEKTIAKYVEQLSRQQKLLDAVFQPQVRLNRADEEQLLVIKVEWSPGLEQEEPEELPQVIDEQVKVWTSPEGEQFGGLDEAHMIQLTLTPVPVKSEEDDKEEAQSVQHHHSQTEDSSDTDYPETEAGGENTGGSEAASNLSVEDHVQAETHVNKSDSSRAQNDNSDAEEIKKQTNKKHLHQGTICGATWFLTRWRNHLAVQFVKNPLL